MCWDNSPSPTLSYTIFLFPLSEFLSLIFSEPPLHSLCFFRSTSLSLSLSLSLFFSPCQPSSSSVAYASPLRHRLFLKSHALFLALIYYPSSSILISLACSSLSWFLLSLQTFLHFQFPSLSHSFPCLFLPLSLSGNIICSLSQNLLSMENILKTWTQGF